MRYFAAIPLPDPVKLKVSEIIRGRLPVPYVNTANLHITLNFFGELDSDSLKRLLEVFAASVPKTSPLAIEFDQLTKFRTQLHLTVKPNSVLVELQSQMQKYFQQHGFEFEKREYYPHVKLTNLHMDKIMNRERKIENFPNAELAKLNFTAEKIVLFESKLLLHHVQHKPLQEVVLPVN